MRDRPAPSLWFPDRPPKRSEIVSASCALALLLLHLPRVQALSWQGAGVGFVAVTLALGPVATTPLGGAVGRRFRAIGVGGRLAVFVFYCCMVVLLVVFAPVPLAFFENAAIGGLLAIMTYLVAYLVWARAGRGRRVAREEAS